MLSVTRAQPRTVEHVMPRSARAQPRTIFSSGSIISGIRSVRFVQFARFVKLRQNLDRAKLTSRWSTWRRRVNDSGLRATSLSYRLIRAETYSLLYFVRDKLILLSDQFRVKNANALSDFSHSLTNTHARKWVFYMVSEPCHPKAPDSGLQVINWIKTTILDGLPD